ncbi:MAG: PrgI family protein [Desulforudis sp.]|nr:MAG: PrgI family protein [Desulforudis sp.]
MEEDYAVPPDFKYSPHIWRDFSLKTFSYFLLLCYPAFLLLKSQASAGLRLFLAIPLVACAWMLARYEKYGQGLDRMLFNWACFRISPRSFRQFSSGSGRKAPSTRDLLPIGRLEPDMVELAGGTAIKILRVSSLNFGLLSEQEKRSTEKAFRGLCHSLSRGFPVQVFMRSRKITREDIISGLERPHAGAGYEKAQRQYIEFLRGLAEEGNVHQKEFFLVISYNIYSLPARKYRATDYLDTAKGLLSQRGKEVKIKDAREQLKMREEIIRSGLKRCGIEAETLDRAGIAQLLYEVLNPDLEGDLSRRQDIRPFLAQGIGEGNLAEVVAPPSVELAPGHIRVGKLYIRILAIMEWPACLWSGWVQDLNDLADDMDISIHISPRDMGSDMRYIAASLRKMHGATMADKLGNMPTDQLTEVKKEKTEKLMRSFASGEEKLFDYLCLLAVKAYSTEELEEKTEMVVSKMAAREITVDVPRHLAKDAFLSYVPLGLIALPFTRGFTSSLIGASFPLSSTDMSSGGGVLYGTSEDGSSLVMLDRFAPQMPNHSMAIVGQSGQGKSFFAKALLTRELARGVSVVCIDPEREYRAMCEALGGQYIAFEPRSGHSINPLDRSFRLEDSSLSGTDNLVRENMIFLKLILADAKMDYRPLEAEDLLYEVYRRYERPLLADLKEVAAEMGLQDIHHALRPWTEGTLRGLFDRETNVDLSSPFVAFDLSGIKREHRGLAIAVIDGWFWRKIRDDRTMRIFQVDEASWLLRDYECAEAFENLARRGRKYGVSFVIIDQQLDQLFANDKSRAIVSNCAIKCLFGMDKGLIDNYVSKAITLTEREQEMMATLTKGECIIHAGVQRALTRVVASREETRLFSTSLGEAV